MNKSQIQNIISSLSFDFPYAVDDWMQHLYMENHHCHKDFSNTVLADSPTPIVKYAERIKQLGTKCLYSGEHGSQGNQFEVYECAEKNGLRYVHSAEVYWVKDRHTDDNANCHMMIVATCAEGREDLNYILSIANKDGYYYRPRIDLELLLSVKPENFIITSACVAGWKYEDADVIWMKIARHFGNNFFFEVQTHNTEPQKKLNAHIIDLAKRHNIQIICGLDSHFINPEDSIKRDVILEYKKDTLRR